MKFMLKILILLLIVSTPIVASCMGPIFIGPKTASWDAVTEATGYYIYWRSPGATTWPTAQRAQTNAITLDLVNAGVPQGSWEICATAFDAISESGPSNIVPWSYAIKSAPGNMKVQ
jgi:hypothetical protein